MAIKINLGKERKRPAGPRAGGLSLPKLSVPGGAAVKGASALLVVVVLILGGWGLVEWWKTKALEQEIITLRARDQQLQTQLAELRSVEAAKKEIQRRLDIIGRVAKSQGLPVTMMNAVLKSVPQGIWLSSLDVKPQEVRVRVEATPGPKPLVGSSETLGKLEEKKQEAGAPGRAPGARPAATKEVTEIQGYAVVIKGTAFNNFQVADFMTNLKKAGVFSDVDFTVTQASSVEQVRVMSFEVTASVKL